MINIHATILSKEPKNDVTQHQIHIQLLAHNVNQNTSMIKFIYILKIKA